MALTIPECLQNRKFQFSNFFVCFVFVYLLFLILKKVRKVSQIQSIKKKSNMALSLSLELSSFGKEFFIIMKNNAKMKQPYHNWGIKAEFILYFWYELARKILKSFNQKHRGADQAAILELHNNFKKSKWSIYARKWSIWKLESH